jgi:hypothetical protein
METIAEKKRLLNILNCDIEARIFGNRVVRIEVRKYNEKRNYALLYFNEKEYVHVEIKRTYIEIGKVVGYVYLSKKIPYKYIKFLSAIYAATT